MAYEKQNPMNNATPWDEDYWGAMDDAVADHDSRLDTAESDIAQNKSDIEQAGSDIDEVDQKITDEAKTREDKDDELSEKIQSNTDLIDSLTDFISGNGTQIPVNSDLDDYTTGGKYYVGSAANAATMENGPTTSYAFTLLVIKSYIPPTMQIAFLNRQGTPTNGAVFYRNCSNSGSWTTWLQIC